MIAGLVIAGLVIAGLALGAVLSFLVIVALERFFG